MAKPRVFKDEWISRFGPWLEKKDNQGWCTLCSVPLTTKDMGVTAITQHIKTAKHMKNVDSGEKKTQPKLGQFFVKTEAQSHDVWTVKDLTAKAEIVAAMWFCSGNTSFMTDLDDVSLYLEEKDFVKVQGTRVQQALGKLTDAPRKFILGMQSFYIAAIKELQKKLPLDSDLLSALTCLDPKNQKSLDSLLHCKVVAQALPCITEKDDSRVGDEWVRFQEVNIQEKDSHMRVDHFWQSIFDKGDACGDAFQVLPKLVKCALSLSHSNADVERSLSVNKRVLTKEKTAMNTETLIGIRHVKAAIAIHGDVTKVPVTRELLKAAQGAYAMYAAKLQEEREKNRLKEKQDIEKKEKESRKRQAEGRYNDLLQELEGLNKEADIVKEQLAITIDSVKKETAKITAAKGNAMQIAAAANQLEFWGKHQTELSAKLDEIDKKRREKEEEKNAMTKLKKSKH